MAAPGFWSELTLSFALMVMGYQLASVNELRTPLAPPEALDQMGEALPRLIEALANAPVDGGRWYSQSST